MPRNLAEKSKLALLLASEMQFDTVKERARWLYDFGRLPVQTCACSICTDGIFADMVSAGFQPRSNSVWNGFTRPVQSTPRFKLYISPKPEQFQQCLELAADYLTSPSVKAFKLVTHPELVVRSDKFVAYFHDEDSRCDWIEATIPALENIESHGVPFTYQVSDGGLLSVAEDPVVTGGKMESWRSRLVRVAATGLQNGNLESAIEALWQSGIDPIRWMLSADGIDTT